MSEGKKVAKALNAFATCTSMWVVFWPEIYRELLGIPKSKLIVDGIAIGYPDFRARVNNYPRHRESVDAFTNWHGF